MKYKIEYEINKKRIVYKINGVVIENITTKMVQDLYGPFGTDVEKHIAKLYREKIVEVRDFKLNSLGI